MKTVIAGTRNPAKVAALRDMLDGVANVVPPPDATIPDVPEEGREIGEVAVGKARAWTSWLRGLGSEDPVIVTDGGLLVPGLGDVWNPTLTRRFAGPDASPVEIARALLALAAGLTGDDRRIGWREVAVLAIAGGSPKVFEAESPPGVLAATIGDNPVGDNGFWVPAVWLCPEFGLKRLRDLTPVEQASRDDHWARLRRDLRAELSDRADGREDGC